MFFANHFERGNNSRRIYTIVRIRQVIIMIIIIITVKLFLL